MKTLLKSRILFILIIFVIQLSNLFSQITYYLDPAAIECPKREKMIISMDTCLYVHNKFSNYKEHVLVIYDPKVETANAGYKGRIAFGGSAGDKTGTHEMQHILGIGTYSKWGSKRDKNNNIWLGEKALAQLAEFDGAGAVLHADQSHFWPYGINTKWDDTRKHMYLVGAIREDMGLSNTTGQGTGVYCNPPTLIPRTQINSSSKILSAFSFPVYGDSVTLSADDIVGAKWNWSGPNDFVSESREARIGNVTPEKEGIYTVICTNECGEKSSREFTIVAHEKKTYYKISCRTEGFLLRPVSEEDGAEITFTASVWDDEWVQWEKIDTENGYFYLKNRKTGKFFKPKDENQPTPYAQVTGTFAGNWLQWRLVGVEGGYGHLINRETYRKIRINTDDIFTAGTEQTGAGSAGEWTQWRFIPVADLSNSIIENQTDVIKLFPNPASEVVNIELKMPVSDYIEIDIVNQLGQIVDVVFKGISVTGSEKLQWEIPSSISEKGSMFFLKLKSERHNFTSKILVAD